MLTVDVNLARKAGLGIKTKTKIVWELADSSKVQPIGQTATKEKININGVEVALYLLVAESNSTYDILLGRDWLHLVNAKGNYVKNMYMIEAGGNSAKLKGQVYQVSKVTLSDSLAKETSSEEESSSEDESEESSSKSEESEESEEEVSVLAFLARGHLLDEFDVKPRASMVSMGKAQSSKVEVAVSAKILMVEQLKEVNINPKLEEGQHKEVEDLLWEY